MTKRDFFILSIRLFGLSSLVTSLFALPAYLPFLSFKSDVESWIWPTCIAAGILTFFILLVLYAGKVVALLKLDKGFEDDRIELGNLNADNIVKIGTFIIGGLLIVNNIPQFLSNVHLALKSSENDLFNENKDNYHLIISGIKLIVGYLLIRNYHLIAKLLAAPDKKES